MPYILFGCPVCVHGMPMFMGLQCIKMSRSLVQLQHPCQTGMVSSSQDDPLGSLFYGCRLVHHQLSAGPICQGLNGVKMGGLSGTLMLWVVCCSLLGELKAPVCWLAATHQGRRELPLPWCSHPPAESQRYAVPC